MQNLGHISTETKGTRGTATEQGVILGFDPR